MRYWQSYRFVFNNPNWLTNLLLAAVCSIVPIIGQIVLIGYCFEVIDVLLRRRPWVAADPKDEGIMDALPVDDDHDSASYPDFDFHRFAEYLMRGIWPFLVRMIVNFVIGMIVAFFLIVGMMLAGFAAAAADSPVLIFVLYGLFLVVYAFLLTVAGILTTPLYLRAGLSGDFASAFSMAFYRGFLRRVGKEVILAELFLLATGAVVSIGGLLLCYVGIFPAIALLLYVHHHLEYQLYELYLERGGEPVKRKQKSPSHTEDYRDEESSSSPGIRPQSKDRFTDVRRPEEDW